MTVKLRESLFISLLLPLLFALTQTATAQSSDQSLPTAVLSNEITGKIVPLDLGDPRLTRHFYAFEGVPGDVLITVEGRNLNGDVDVFTAITFRPLVKFTTYSSSQSSGITKSIYLRSRQILILRVEARTPNDDPGFYTIRFGGSFTPFSGGIPVAENNEPESDTTRPASRSGKRVSSVGARIDEPVAEVAATPTPEVKETPVEKPPEETPAPKKTARAPKPKVTRPAPAPRNTRNRPPRSVKPKSTQTETAATDAPKEPLGEGEAKNNPDTAEKPPAAKTEPQEIAPPPVGARLIIETKDGNRIERPMSTVRRVVIEGSTIVIVLKTGKIERVLMSLVARMAIEP